MVPEGVILPILPADSVNQILPSGPAVMSKGRALADKPLVKVVTVPDGVIWPMRVAPGTVNQRLPSGPAVIEPSPLDAGKIAGRYRVTTPPGVILPTSVGLPIFDPLCAPTNQRLPSGPAVIPNAWSFVLFWLMLNSVMLPAGVLRPISPSGSVNQRLPSGPAVMSNVSSPPLALNWVMAPAVVIYAQSLLVLSSSFADFWAYFERGRRLIRVRSGKPAAVIASGFAEAQLSHPARLRSSVIWVSQVFVAHCFGISVSFLFS